MTNNIQEISFNNHILKIPLDRIIASNCYSNILAIFELNDRNLEKFNLSVAIGYLNSYDSKRVYYRHCYLVDSTTHEMAYDALPLYNQIIEPTYYNCKVYTTREYKNLISDSIMSGLLDGTNTHNFQEVSRPDTHDKDKQLLASLREVDISEIDPNDLELGYSTVIKSRPQRSYSNEK